MNSDKAIFEKVKKLEAADDKANGFKSITALFRLKGKKGEPCHHSYDTPHALNCGLMKYKTSIAVYESDCPGLFNKGCPLKEMK